MNSSWAALISVASIVFGPGAFAVESRFCEQSVMPAVSRPASRAPIERYHSRAGDENVSQRFVDLANRGALKDQPQRSVQCSPTCGVNHLYAAFDLLGLDTTPFSFYFEDTIARIGRIAAKKFAVNSRDGVDIQKLGPVLEQLGREAGVAIETQLDWDANIENLVPQDNELLIASLNLGIRADGRTELHAVAILDAIPESNMLLLSNPVESNSLYWTEATPAENEAGKPSVRIDTRGFVINNFTGTILRVLRIKFPQLNSAPQTAIAKRAQELQLEGKYVHFRFKTGDGVFLLRKITPQGFLVSTNSIASMEDRVLPFDEIVDLRKFEPALKEEAVREFAGKTVRIEWHFSTAKNLSSEIRREKFTLMGFQKEDGPHGSLRMQAAQKSYLVPLEFVRRLIPAERPGATR